MARKFPVPIPHGPPRGHDSLETLLAHAAYHSQNRLLHACEAISWIGGLALQGRIRHTPVFSLEGAEVQDATAGSGEQAAHVLPGQILIDGHPPWALVSGDRMKVAWLARFMVTSAVPTAFNVADSAAEQAGLKEAFRRSCTAAWTLVVEGQRDLTPIYAAFLKDADRAFRKAEHAKQGKRAAASSKGHTVKGDDRFIESTLLHMYRLHAVTASEANRLFPLTTRLP